MTKKAYFKEDFVDVRIKEGGFYRTLLTSLSFFSAIKKDIYTVPIGFVTDLGSIPKSLQGLVPKDGLSTLPYIAHDWLYKQGITTRDEADDILKELQKAQGVNSFIQNTVRFGLWVGGWKAWDEHRLND